MKQIRYIESRAGSGRIIMVGATGLIGVYLLIKLINSQRKMSSAKRVVTDDNVRLATQLNTALNPDRNWFTGLFSGADKDELFRLAGQIKNFEDIAQEYKNLYDESLILELQDALGTDYNSFMNKLLNVNAGTDVLSDENAENLVKELYDEIDGLRMFKHDLQPFYELMRLSDHNFIRVVTMYNTKHRSFKEDVEGETVVGLLMPDYSWGDMKDNILARIEKLMK